MCCNDTTNKYLKQIGQLAGLDDVVVKVRSKGKTRVEQRLQIIYWSFSPFANFSIISFMRFSLVSGFFAV